MRGIRFSTFFMFFIFTIKIHAQDCGDKLVNLSYSLNDVSYVSNETFFAIGAGGKMVKTNDGGKTWKEIVNGSSTDLIKIQFVTDSIGYILGDYSNLIKTIDGGETWFPLQNVNPNYPYCGGFYFISPDTGFVFGGVNKMFKTTDGGRIWKMIDNYGSSEWDQMTFTSMTFINKNLGFVCGNDNTLLKTIDSGESWDPIDMSIYGNNGNFIKVVFVDANIGYILNANSLIIKTVNGGDTWAKVGQASTDYASSMIFIDKNIGFVVGGWNSPILYRTMNGGLTWQSVNSVYTGSLLGIAMNKNGTKGVVVGDGEGFGNKSGRIIFYYDELSNNWKNSCDLNGSFDFHDLTFTDDQTGFLVGGSLSSGILYKTQDNGLTWNPLNLYPARNIYQIYSLNRDTFYISADSTYMTADGGHTWKSVSEYAGKMYFNKNEGIILDLTNIYRTNNYGETWKKVLTEEQLLTDMFFTDAATGYAVGYYCSYKSVDSGKVWIPYPELPSCYYTSIYFQNKDTGFAGGDNGLLYKTVNGGLSWESISTNITDIQIIDIKFKNETEGYIIANNGGGGTSNIYSSQDGGNSWQFLSQISDDITNIAVDFEGNFYFPGERGVLVQVTKNSPPGISGYISGELTVVKNTLVTYSTVHQQDILNQWMISNDQVFESYNDSIKVNFPISGIYTISVTPFNDCGSGLSRCIEITVLDSLLLPIPDVDQLESEINIYPNPFNEKINILLPPYGKYKITIYDVNGKVVKTTESVNLKNTEISIDTYNLEKGIYVLEINGSRYRKRTKLLKLH